MKNAIHLSVGMVCILVVSSLVSCSNIFTKREDTESSSTVLSLDCSRIISSRAASTAASSYTLVVSVFDSEDTELAAVSVNSETSSSTITIDGLTSGQTVYVTVRVTSSGGEILYTYVSDIITLIAGTNTIAFGNDFPAVLYDLPGFTINYTNNYTATSGTTLPSTTEKIVSMDFAPSGTIVVYRTETAGSGDVGTVYSYYAFMAGYEGTKQTVELYTTSNSDSTVQIAVDRTSALLYFYCYNISTDTATVPLLFCCSALAEITSPVKAGFLSSEAGLEKPSDVLLTAYNGMVYLYDKSTPRILSLTYASDAWSVSGTTALSVSSLTGISKLSVTTNGTYAVISDMKYYNGSLWLLLNHRYSYDGYSQTSRGGLLQLDPENIGVLSSIEISDSSLIGWSTDKDVSCYRPGAVSGSMSPDTALESAPYFYGPTHIVALTPKKLYIADDGVYASSVSKSVYHMAQRNRLAVYDMAEKELSMKSVSVEFDEKLIITSASTYITD